MLRKIKNSPLSMILLFALAGLAGCSVFQPKDEPETLSSKEIYELLTADDDAPKVKVAKARVISQGTYRSEQSQTIAVRTDGCPNARFLMLQRGREVTARLGQWIGFEFVLDGSRSVPEDADPLSPPLVPLTVVVRHPPYRNPMTGQVVRDEIHQFSACLGRPGFAVWRLTADWELVGGLWECELQSGGVPLAAVRFLVRGEVPPLADTAMPSEQMDQIAVPQQPDAADLTVAVQPNSQNETVAAVPPRQEAPQEVVDFSEDKLLAKWVRVPGVRPATTHTPPQGAVRQAQPRSAPPARQYAPTADRQTAAAVSAEPYARESLAGQPGVVVVVSSNQYEKNARNEVLHLRSKGYPAFLGQYKDPRTGRLWHTVRLEGFSSVPQAGKAKSDFMRREGRQAFVAVRGSVPNPVRQPAAKNPQPLSEQQILLPSKVHYEPTVLLPPPLYGVQVGACLLPESARTMKRELQAKGYAVRIVLLKDAGGKLWHRVLIGPPHGSKAEARKAVRAYKAREGKKAYVIDAAGRVVRN